MVHPQCRGYIHRTVLLFNFLQNNSSDLQTQPQIRPSSLTTHSVTVPLLQTLNCALSCSSFLTTLSCALSCSSFPHTNPLRTQLQRSSTHTAGTCSFLTKSNLTLPCLSYIKNLTYPFSISAYLYCAALQKPWS